MELRFTKGKHGRLPKEKNNETLIFNEQTMLILKQLKFLTSLRTLIYGTMENARYHGKKTMILYRKLWNFDTIAMEKNLLYYSKV